MKAIVVRQNGESCIIRWLYLDKRYSLTWGKWSDRVDRARMEYCAKMIYQDCLVGELDTSLKKYKYWLEGIIPTSSGNGNGNSQPPQPKLPDLISLLEERLKDYYNSADSNTLRLLKLYKKKIDNPTEAKNFMKWLITRGIKDSSRKRYLTVLKILRKDLFGEIYIKVAEKPIAKPFTIAEVRRILDYLQNDQHYSHYYPFIVFLFNTGTRVSEAIGVRNMDVDLKKREIHLYESLGRGEKGSTSDRQRKPTKTHKYRIIPINDRLFEILKERVRDDSDNLIFTTPKGLPLDDHNISQRCWKITLEKLGIKHRPLKTTRSTFVSHCIDSGMTVQEVSTITGHSIQVLIDSYLGSVKKPKLPEL